MAQAWFAHPRRNLILLIIGIAAAPLVTLFLLGWRLLDQDRLLHERDAQERLERSADAVATAIQRAVNASAERLASGAREWPSGAVAITFRDGQVESSGAIAWAPVVPPLREAPIESSGHNLTATDPALRAAALLRHGRALTKAAQVPAAIDAYAQLARIDQAAINGTPASLVGQFALCELLEKNGPAAEFRAQTNRFAADLASSRWKLSEPVYLLYSEDAERWTGRKPDAASMAFAEATAELWASWRSLPQSGARSLPAGGLSLAAVWRTSNGAFRALLATPAFVESQWTAAAHGAARQNRIRFQIEAGPATVAQARRRAADTGLPWDIAVTSLDPPEHDPSLRFRRRLLIGGFAMLVLMACAASWLIIRAVNREAALARLQSDFVAAVSHEFRTPLTALRQFTDRLRESRQLTEDDRRVCYDAQSRATDRLMGLVETLLDFGRIEAGARRYNFERRECAQLVRSVVEDFRREAQAASHEIEFDGGSPAGIDADAEAMSRAVRNLLDNAVKYSPGGRRIEVGLSRRDSTVRIAVRDHGIGIPRHEQSAIFSKFQRGDEARTRGIKGTGIGLTMVDEIVRAHRGRVEVESEPGQGSTFTIVLPAKEETNGSHSRD